MCTRRTWLGCTTQRLYVERVVYVTSSTDSDAISGCVPLVAECKTKGCDHLCISTAGGHGQCMCSQDYELQADNKTCKSKHNYHFSRNVVANIGTITICFQKHYANWTNRKNWPRHNIKMTHCNIHITKKYLGLHRCTRIKSWQCEYVTKQLLLSQSHQEW